MAYFRKRGKTWSFTIDGKERGGFRTKKEAEISATKMQLEINTGTYIQPSEITFKEYAENVWLPAYSQSVKELTIYNRKYNIRLLIEAYGESAKLKSINSIFHEKAMHEIFNKVARNSFNSIAATAKMVFRKAANDSVIAINPTINFKAPRKVMTIEEAETIDVPKYLEKHELVKFLSTARDMYPNEDYLVFLLLSYTGMRVGELCALKWSDIDFKSAEISVSKTYVNTTNTPSQYILNTPKTKSSRRKIDIDQELLRELREHNLKQHFTKSKCPNWHSGNFIFTHLDQLGYPIYPTMIWRKMKKALKVAGLPGNLTTHSLRHTHCSLLAEAGASLEEIQARLGQTDEGTTRRVYLHITQSRKKDTMQKFSKLMHGIF